mgnify:CR=1 FL=1
MINMILDFLSSDFWKDVQNKVLATISLSATGTFAKAITPTMAFQAVEKSLIVEMTEIFALISYGISILVGLTVLYKFIVWFKDRKKNK